jgi:hypothetical protein
MMSIMMRSIVRRMYGPVGLYIVLALMVLLPLLKPGFVLTVDMVFTPKLPMPSSVTSSYLLHAMLHILNFVVPAEVLEKLILFAGFFLSGLGMDRLFTILRTKHDAAAWRTGAYFAGIFYMINPFVYTRFMAGQYSFLLGYALLPFFVTALLRLLEQPNIRRGLLLAMWALLISIVSIHMTGIGGIAAGVLFLAAAWRHRKTGTWITSRIVWLSGVLLVVALASSYWLMPLILGHGTTAGILSSFTGADQRAFQTSAGSLGLSGTVLALQGFWADSANLYLLPQDVFGWWLVPVLLMWAIVLAGCVWAWRHRRGSAIAWILIGVAGFILTVGSAGTIFAPLNRALYAHLPWFDGYRDSQKFSALLAITYAYFGGLGAMWTAKRLEARKAGTYAAVWLLLPLFCTPLLLWGADGQLHAQGYPSGWIRTNRLLSRLDTTHENVVFFPWHLYMPLSFGSGVVANPAPQFFAVPIISSQDPEIGGAHGYYTTPDARIFAMQIEPAAANNPNLAQSLRRIHVGYIVVAKEYDYKNYDYLQQVRDISQIESNNTVMVYKVNGE